MQLPLISNKYKRLGMLLFSIGLILGIIYMYDNFEPNFLQYNFGNHKLKMNEDSGVGGLFSGNFLWGSAGNFMDEIIVLLVILGGCLWGFSREKEEDEYLSQIRLNALTWAFLINYLLVILCTIFIYDFWYLDVLIFNVVTPLIIFLSRYNFLLIKLKKS